MGGRRTSLSVVLTAPRVREKFLAALEKRLSGDRGWWHIPGAHTPNLRHVVQKYRIL